MTKTRNIIGWVLSGLLAALFLFSAYGKLAGIPQVVEGAKSMGLTMDIMRTLGIIEIVSVLLFLIPRTGILGTLLLAAYLGGAIATHLEHGIPIIQPCIFEAVLWIAALLRFPELGTRISGK